MRHRRDRSRGSVAVELALTLPFLCLLIIGGWVLCYLAYTKMALAMAAGRAARDLAAAVEEYPSLPHVTKAYRFDGGFGDSFGLPRWGVHGLVTKTRITEGNNKAPSEFAVVAAVCYRVPFTLPSGVTKQETPVQVLPDTSDVEAAVMDVAALLELNELRQAVAQYQALRRQVEAEARGWEQLLDDASSAVERGKDIWAMVQWLLSNGQSLFSSAGDLTPYPAGIRMRASKLEETVRKLCEPPERLRGQSIILTSRAAFMMHPVDDLSAASGQKGGQGTTAGTGKRKGKTK